MSSFCFGRSFKSVGEGYRGRVRRRWGSIGKIWWEMDEMGYVRMRAVFLNINVSIHQKIYSVKVWCDWIWVGRRRGEKVRGSGEER